MGGLVCSDRFSGLTRSLQTRFFLESYTDESISAYSRKYTHPCLFFFIKLFCHNLYELLNLGVIPRVAAIVGKLDNTCTINDKRAR